MRARQSLVWKIAAAFLLTVVAGALIQAIVAVAVLRPLEAREARSRAELVASSLAVEIAASPVPPAGAALDTLLARHRARLGGRGAWILYRRPGAEIVTVPPNRQEWAAALPVVASDTTLERTVTRGPRQVIELVVRRGVIRAGRPDGEVLVIRPSFPRGALAILASPATLLSLPIAALASLIGGLIVVRLLVRRLRGLETLAARVTEGDLSVRIADTSGDEIGQLAERLDRMTGRLAEARDRLAANETQRRQLFADITHELATPLTSIRGYAETLLDPAVPLSVDERGRYLEGVLEESRRLDRLIRDLFELARLEAGAAPLEKEPLDWAALCRNTAHRFEPRFRDAGVRLSWEPKVDEAWIEADGHRLERVLENLLANALRYVPPGGHVALALEPSPGAPDAFRLAVRDDGPGIAPDELPLVFQRFYRGDGEARDDRGSGLGLAIVREIVERHGGGVRAATNLPHGLEITIDLPVRDGVPPAPARTGSPAAPAPPR